MLIIGLKILQKCRGKIETVINVYFFINNSMSVNSRALPSRALHLISEYSKPVTNPEWRYSRPIITTFRLYLTLFSRDTLLKKIILSNILHTNWFEMYLYIKHNGLDKYCCVFDKDYDDTYDIDGVYEAMIHYED